MSNEDWITILASPKGEQRFEEYYLKCKNIPVTNWISGSFGIDEDWRHIIVRGTEEEITEMIMIIESFKKKNNILYEFLYIDKSGELK